MKRNMMRGKYGPNPSKFLIITQNTESVKQNKTNALITVAG